MAWKSPTTRAEAETALNVGQLFVMVRTGNWWVTRRNGNTQTWKRDKHRFRIPFKAGQYVYGAIDQANLKMFRIAASRDEAQAEA